MSVSKEEMERIWRSEPIGYLSSLRGMKQFEVVIHPHKKTYFNKVIVNISAKKKSAVSIYTPAVQQAIKDSLAEQGVDMGKETLAYQFTVVEK